MKENKYKNKSCWLWKGAGAVHSKAEKECKDCTSKRCSKRLRNFVRQTIIKEAVIEQVNEQIHSATSEELFAVSNIILKTNFSTKKHRLISRS